MTDIDIADPDEVASSYEEVDPEWVAFWTGTPRYQPWKDVAAFFRETMTQTENRFCHTVRKTSDKDHQNQANPPVETKQEHAGITKIRL
jgi:hypothetical protein